MFCKGVFCEGVFRKGVFCKTLVGTSAKIGGCERRDTARPLTRIEPVHELLGDLGQPLGDQTTDRAQAGHGSSLLGPSAAHLGGVLAVLAHAVLKAELGLPHGVLLDAVHSHFRHDTLARSSFLVVA